MSVDADLPELPRATALAWGVAATPQRGPRREMSIERIVEAAIDIADAEGLAGVSMSAVAARLGFSPMSLYRYVTAKDDLLLLMLEHAAGAPPPNVRRATDWRTGLAALHDALTDAYLRHPWVLDIPISGAPTTPNSAAWMDAGLAVLASTPLTYEERLAIVLHISGQARWYGTIYSAYARTARLLGETEEQTTVREDALYRRLITAEEFPALREAIDAGVFLAPDNPFVFALQRTLDGIAAYIDRAPPYEDSAFTAKA